MKFYNRTIETKLNVLSPMSVSIPVSGAPISVPIPVSGCCPCNCVSGDCLNLDCACFRFGRYCEGRCANPSCRNNEANSVERLRVIEKLLLQNPMTFTAEDTLNQEEFASICNFAMLTTSVDDTPFKAEHRETAVSKSLSDKVVMQAIRTVMSAPNEDLKSAIPETFEERTENSVAKEFENVLQTIIDHVSKQ